MQSAAWFYARRVPASAANNCRVPMQQACSSTGSRF